MAKITRTSTTKAIGVPAAVLASGADPSTKQIKTWWPNERGALILQIMKNEGISYARAVKRSRRRMLSGAAS